MALAIIGREDMSKYKEEFRFDNGVLYVRLSGKFPKELLHSKENLFQPLINACSSHNCKKVLVDARDVQIDFGTMAIFRAGEDVAFLSRKGLRIALLVTKEMIDPFFETVAMNRGGNPSIFTDMQAARDWIEN